MDIYLRAPRSLNSERLNICFNTRSRIRFVFFISEQFVDRAFGGDFPSVELSGRLIYSQH